VTILAGVTGPEEQALVSAAAAFGRALSSDERSRLLRFFRLLLTWNARINLTGARSWAELLEEHLPDALVLERAVGRGVSLVDVGSGGGLPALPFAVLRPDVALTLVEPRAKRVAFLRTDVREVGVSAAVLASRAEELAAGGFDAAASRATFAPEEWLVMGRRLVRPAGQVFLFLPGPPTPVLPAGERFDYRAGRRDRCLLAVRST